MGALGLAAMVAFRGSRAPTAFPGYGHPVFVKDMGRGWQVNWLPEAEMTVMGPAKPAYRFMGQWSADQNFPLNHRSGYVMESDTSQIWMSIGLYAYTPLLNPSLEDHVVNRSIHFFKDTWRLPFAGVHLVRSQGRRLSGEVSAIQIPLPIRPYRYGPHVDHQARKRVHRRSLDSRREA